MQSVDAIKSFKEHDKDDVAEADIKHNFEADIYLEKLDHETEKVGLTMEFSRFRLLKAS